MVWANRVGVWVILVQVLGNYMIVRYLDPEVWERVYIRILAHLIGIETHALHHTRMYCKVAIIFLSTFKNCRA